MWEGRGQSARRKWGGGTEHEKEAEQNIWKGRGKECKKEERKTIWGGGGYEKGVEGEREKQLKIKRGREGWRERLSILCGFGLIIINLMWGFGEFGCRWKRKTKYGGRHVKVSLLRCESSLNFVLCFFFNDKLKTNEQKWKMMESRCHRENGRSSSSKMAVTRPSGSRLGLGRKSWPFLSLMMELVYCQDEQRSFGDEIFFVDKWGECDGGAEIAFASFFF